MSDATHRSCGSRSTYPKVAHRQTALLEDLQWMLDSQRPISEIAQRLGKSPATLARTLYRWGQRDLARLFDREVAA